MRPTAREGKDPKHCFFYKRYVNKPHSDDALLQVQHRSKINSVYVRGYVCESCPNVFLRKSGFVGYRNFPLCFPVIDEVYCLLHRTDF